MIEQSIIKLQKEVLYPTVRVFTEDSGGSGTVLCCKVEDGVTTTVVMTNYHVISDSIKVEEDWDPLYGMDMKKEFKSTVLVDIFKYNNNSKCIGSFTVEADIVAYDSQEDMALLILRDKETVFNHVARLYPISEVSDIQIFDNVIAVGASLGHPPLPTDGRIGYMDDEINNYKYYLITAPGIYGSSGGAVFRYSKDRDIYEYMAIPSNVEAYINGFTEVTVNHMMFAIPIDRIAKFIDKNNYQYIYDDSKTIAECDKARAEATKEKEDEKKRKHGTVRKGK